MTTTHSMSITHSSLPFLLDIRSMLPLSLLLKESLSRRYRKDCMNHSTFLRFKRSSKTQMRKSSRMWAIWRMNLESWKRRWKSYQSKCLRKKLRLFVWITKELTLTSDQVPDFWIETTQNWVSIQTNLREKSKILKKISFVLSKRTETWGRKLRTCVTTLIWIHRSSKKCENSFESLRRSTGLLWKVATLTLIWSRSHWLISFTTK